jgi:carboxypeptidase D
MYSQTFLTHLDSVAAACHYSDYVEKHVTYPPHGLLPLPGKSTEFDPGCDVWDEIFNATLLVNPAFNMYHIFDMVGLLLCSWFLFITYCSSFIQWPIIWDVLGFP